ncbi:MAG: hypothetical protein AABW83_03465 [Nanoarchaeota archaeon]
MISWIVILILIIIGIFAIRLNHLKHRFLIILLILLALFLYSSINLVTIENNLNLETSDGIFSAIKVYFGWLTNGFNNLKEISGKAISLDWKNSNASFSEK